MRSQRGGGRDISTNIEYYIGSIVNGEYKLQTDLDIIKNITFEKEQCTSNFLGNPGSNNGFQYKPHFLAICFLKEFGGVSKNERFLYLFKKYFNLSFTDFYMKYGLQKDDLKISTNYVYFLLNYTTQVLIEKLINVNYFGEKTVLLQDKIKLLYKGGNTTRLLVRSFTDNVTKQLKNKHIDSVSNALNKLNSIIQKSNIGDWDYNVSINYDYLKKHNYDDGELLTLVKLVSQSFYYTASYIKTQLHTMLMSKINIDNLAENIQGFMFNNDMQDFLDHFVNTYNHSDIKAPGEEINSMSVDKVCIFDKIINKNQISTMKLSDLGIIDRKSFIYNTSDELIDNQTMDTYIETDQPFIDTKLAVVIPEIMPTDNIYLVYMNHLVLMKKYKVSSFNLLRVKINNEIKFNVNIKNDDVDTSRSKKMFVNFELVDVSVSTPYDNIITWINLYFYPDTVNMVDYHIKNSNFPDQKIITKVPSPQYMFGDIAVILFEEHPFIWHDQKYAKRIQRLFILILLSFYQDGLTTNDIYEIYSNIETLFRHLTAADNLRSRLEIFQGQYNIIVNPHGNKINENSRVYYGDKYHELNIEHLLLRIKSDSPYHYKYIEFLLSNYIRMILIGNYIINNNVNSSDQEFVRYELFPNRLVELPNIQEYVTPSVNILTQSLTDLYMEVRGTSHNLEENQLLPLGPLPNLPPADTDTLIDFINKMKTYETTIIQNCAFVLDILKGFRDGDLQDPKIVYAGESFY